MEARRQLVRLGLPGWRSLARGRPGEAGAGGGHGTGLGPGQRRQRPRLEPLEASGPGGGCRRTRQGLQRRLESRAGGLEASPGGRRQAGATGPGQKAPGRAGEAARGLGRTRTLPPDPWRLPAASWTAGAASHAREGGRVLPPVPRPPPRPRCQPPLRRRCCQPAGTTETASASGGGASAWLYAAAWTGAAGSAAASAKLTSSASWSSTSTPPRGSSVSSQSGRTRITARRA